MSNQLNLAYASHYALYKADFKKKGEITSEFRKTNKALAEKYNCLKGIFH